MENIFTHWESVINFTRNDIVFEYQNKQYGAYAIRKYYPERLRNAFLYTVAGMCLLLAVPFAIQKLFPAARHIEIPPGEGIIYVERPIYLQDEKPQVTETKQQKKVKTEDPYYRASDTRTETNPDPQKETTPPTDNTGTTNTDGGEVTPKAGTTFSPPVEPTADTVKFAPIMPSFDGLEAYLKKNTVYPYKARELGAQGKVYVTFVVDRNGKVIKAFVARGIQDEGGDMLEAEALRVVRLMPDWEPGKDALRNPIAVQLTLPINFVLKEK